MRTLLKSRLHKASALVASYRVHVQTVLGLLLLWVVTDGLFMDRSIEHMLVGHTALLLFILVGMVLVEGAVCACHYLDCHNDCDAGSPGPG